jgi:hypothetical protein
MNADAPFLPPAEPGDKPKPVFRKTILLWLLLILMFVSIYQLFSGPPPKPRRAISSQEVVVAPPPRPPAPETDLVTLLLGSWLPMLAVIGVFYGIGFGLVRRQVRGTGKLAALLEPGHLALADGDVAGAVKTYEAAARKFRGQRAYAGMAKLGLADARMRQGDFDGALKVLNEVEQSPGVLYASELRLLAAVDFGLAYALRGETDVATRWLDDARRRLARTPGVRTSQAGLLCLAEVITLARAGKRHEATRLLERDWSRVEATVLATVMRRGWLLRAFLAGTDPSRATAEPYLTMLRSGRRGELDWMATKWPELKAFLVAHELSATL